MILLYSSEEKNFYSNGLGVLSDAISCTVTEERNGAYELQMVYPIDGIHYTEIASRRIIMARPNPYSAPQPFRVYRITKPLNGRVAIYAEHISYDLSGIPVSSFTAGSVTGAFSNFKSQSAIENPFEFWTDKATQAALVVDTPSSIRSLLGGSQGSILDVYGGEYEFDRWTVKLWSQRGQDSGVTIRYGKNLTDLQQDENISNVATGVYPYWRSSSEDATLVELPEKIVNAPGTYNFTRIIPLDLSSEFQEEPTVDQLRTRAVQYVKNNNIGVPTVSLTVAFQPLEQTEEYKNIALLERVNLCDTVTVEYPALGVSAKAKCVKTVYDALKDRYTSIELGDARTNIADTIAKQQQEIERLPDSTAFQVAVNNATNWLTNGQKGEMVAIKKNGRWVETASLDTGDITTAQSVWRWNNGGFGHSSTGYNGPYALALTADGQINASMITTGTMSANLIKTGRIQSHTGAVYFDLDAHGGRGELAASVLKGVADGATTTAEIGQGQYVDGTPYEGLRIDTSSGAGSSFIIALDKNAGIGQRANGTELMAFGDLDIRSAVAPDDNDKGCRIHMTSRAGQGQIGIMRGLPSGQVTYVLIADNEETSLYKDANCVRLLNDQLYFYHNQKITFATGEYIRASIERNGDAKFGNLYSNGIQVTSDRAKKADIVPLESPVLDKISGASVYRYKLKDQDDKERIGIMYDEAPDEIRRVDNSGNKTVDLYGMVSLLWQAVQELNDKIETLQRRGKN